jgi:hypothetical protein
MRYPPASRFLLGPSRNYRFFAVAIAALLIAICAIFIRENGLFSLKTALFGVLATVAALGLLCDAWKTPEGSLRYSQGHWTWLYLAKEETGTLLAHLDLQDYMLVSFTPHSRNNRFFSIRRTWFHLEAQHADPAPELGSGPASWQALRRAVYAAEADIDEAVVA